MNGPVNLEFISASFSKNLGAKFVELPLLLKEKVNAPSRYVLSLDTSIVASELQTRTLLVGVCLNTTGIVKLVLGKNEYTVTFKKPGLVRLDRAVLCAAATPIRVMMAAHGDTDRNVHINLVGWEVMSALSEHDIMKEVGPFLGN